MQFWHDCSEIGTVISPGNQLIWPSVHFGCFQIPFKSFIMLANIPSRYLMPTPLSPDLESDPHTDIPPNLPSPLPVKRPFPSLSASLPLPTPLSPPSEDQWTGKSQSYIYSLLEKETLYTCDPFALQLHQPHLSPLMRAILLDWMLQVSSELTFKRETYYQAANLVDRYLAVRAAVQRDRLQLVGLAALLVAAKAEETANPSLEQFAQMADNGFSQGEIREMEVHLLKSLSWRIFPPTIFAWMSVMMSLWDDYMAFVSVSLPQASSQDCIITFKQANQRSYSLYRETMQIIDVAYLDFNALRYSSRHLVAGLLYLMTSKCLYETEYRLLKAVLGEEEIGSLEVLFGPERLRNSREYVDKADQLVFATQFQSLFLDFLRSSVEIHYIEEIYPAVAYLHGFLGFEPSFELPEVCKVKPKEELERHYEDFLAYQTHNPAGVAFVSQRFSSAILTL